MKEEIANKINNIIHYIIDKPVEDITYNEYCILDAKLKEIQYEDDSLSNREEFQQLMGKVMANSISAVPSTPLMPERK